MGPAAESRRVYRFGVFELDLANRELLRRGAPVRLQDQPFRVLCMLLEKPGEAVTRDALRQALWPSNTYVEFDGSLNAALKRLRFALGDSARNPTFIVTLPKYGYRFIAPVAMEDGAANALSAEETGSDPEAAAVTTSAVLGNGRAADLSVRISRRRAWAHLFVPCAAVIAVHQIVYWFFPLPAPRMINRMRLTHVGNVQPSPIVSDGSHIFFCARRGARYFPMQTSINGGETTEIKTPFETSRILDVSPDRTKFLLGSAERIGDENILWVWPVQGGAPRRFGDVTCTDAIWSPDGRRVVFVSKGTIYGANSDGSGIRALIHKQGYALRWSVDGRKIRFSRWDPFLQVHSMWEAEADGTDLRQLFPGDEKAVDIYAGFWLAGGKYFGFLKGTQPHHQLWMRREWHSLWRRYRCRAEAERCSDRIRGILA